MKNYWVIALLAMTSPLHTANADELANEGHDSMMQDIALEARSDDESIRIAMLVYQDVVLQDFAGPMEVFSKAQNLTQGLYETFTVAVSREQLTTENGLLKISPDYTFDDMPAADYLVIPGANINVINRMVADDDVHNFITSWNRRADATVVTVCTGTYLLADTGMLDNRRATTHFFVADDFAEQYPTIDVARNVRFVSDGDIITSSGITSGIDAALYIVGKNSGVRIRDMISRAMQYEFHVEEAWPVSPNNMQYTRAE